MQMNSLMVCLYTTIIPWLFTMNSVSTPISQAYDSLAIVKMSHPEKNHFFPKNVHFLLIIFWGFRFDLILIIFNLVVSFSDFCESYLLA